MNASHWNSNFHCFVFVEHLFLLEKKNRINNDKEDEIMLKDYIFKRKSTRKYDMTPLDKSKLEEIEDFAKTIRPLYEHITYEYSFAHANDVKKFAPSKSPSLYDNLK